jgi:hypothetical protein
MADSSGCTIRQLLPNRFKHLDDTIGSEPREDSEEGSKKLPGVAARVAAGRAEGALREALDTDVFTLIAQAWAKALELHKAAEDAEASPNKTATVYLGKHEVSADAHPTVEFHFASFGKLTLKLTLELTAELDAAQVTIVDHHIVKIGETQGGASAVLKYGDVELHPRLKSKRIVLTHDLVLKEPLPLVL